MVYGAPKTTGIRSRVNGTFFCPNYFPALRVPTQVVHGQVFLFSVVSLGRVDVGHGVLSW